MEETKKTLKFWGYKSPHAPTITHIFELYKKELCKLIYKNNVATVSKLRIFLSGRLSDYEVLMILERHEYSNDMSPSQLFSIIENSIKK